MSLRSLGYNESILRVCIDSSYNECISGMVFGTRLTSPITFYDLNDFLLKIDEVLDIQNFPQSFQEKRVFIEKDRPAPSAVNPALSLMDEEYVSSQNGKLVTFDIQIATRQNASWQGFIEKHSPYKKLYYNSELELVRAITKLLKS